jgi:hypothetical protein
MCAPAMPSNRSPLTHLGRLAASVRLPSSTKNAVDRDAPEGEVADHASVDGRHGDRALAHVLDEGPDRLRITASPRPDQQQAPVLGAGHGRDRHVARGPGHLVSGRLRTDRGVVELVQHDVVDGRIRDPARGHGVDGERARVAAADADRDPGDVGGVGPEGGAGQDLPTVDEEVEPVGVGSQDGAQGVPALCLRGREVLARGDVVELSIAHGDARRGVQSRPAMYRTLSQPDVCSTRTRAATSTTPVRARKLLVALALPAAPVFVTCRLRSTASGNAATPTVPPPPDVSADQPAGRLPTSASLKSSLRLYSAASAGPAVRTVVVTTAAPTPTSEAVARTASSLRTAGDLMDGEPLPLQTWRTYAAQSRGRLPASSPSAFRTAPVNSNENPPVSARSPTPAYCT